MSYIEKNLMNGESVLYRTKLHWVVFLWPIIWFVVAIMFFSSGGDAAAAGGLFILIAILTGIVSFINFKTSEFGITNKRVVVKVGFIRLPKIQNKNSWHNNRINSDWQLRCAPLPAGYAERYAFTTLVD